MEFLVHMVILFTILKNCQIAFQSGCIILEANQQSVRGSISVDATFSIRTTLSFPHCVYKSVSYICISIASLQIGSSAQFF